MKAGFAKVDITPRVGVELAGFGPYWNRHSTWIRDPLEARAAAFEADGKRVVVIGCDLAGVSAEETRQIRNLIQQKFPDLRDDRIMVCCSHTHSGPSLIMYGWGIMDIPYSMILPHKIARAGIEAIEKLEQVTMSAAVVPCEGIGINRVYDRFSVPHEEGLKEGWRPGKPELTDTKATVIRFTRKDGSLAGFMAHFGCHPVTCGATSNAIHGDYPAVAIHNIMRTNPGSVGIFLQGALGDVNTCVVGDNGNGNESLLALDIIAGRFEHALREGLAKAEPVDDETIHSFSFTADISLRQTFTPEKLAAIKAENQAKLTAPDASDKDYGCRMATVYLTGAEKMEQYLKSTPKPFVDAEIQGIRLGPAALLCSPFEIMQTIKNEVVGAASAPYPLVVGLANGQMGYAPDKTAAAKGGYEADMVPLITGIPPYGNIHEELRNALLKLDKELYQ